MNPQKGLGMLRTLDHTTAGIEYNVANKNGSIRKGNNALPTFQFLVISVS